MPKEKIDFSKLTPEERLQYQKSRRRVMVLLILMDIALAAYLIYEIFQLFLGK